MCSGFVFFIHTRSELNFVHNSCYLCLVAIWGRQITGWWKSLSEAGVVGRSAVMWLTCNIVHSSFKSNRLHAKKKTTSTEWIVFLASSLCVSLSAKTEPLVFQKQIIREKTIEKHYKSDNTNSKLFNLHVFKIYRVSKQKAFLNFDLFTERKAFSNKQAYLQNAKVSCLPERSSALSQLLQSQTHTVMSYTASTPALFSLFKQWVSCTKFTFYG